MEENRIYDLMGAHFKGLLSKEEEGVLLSAIEDDNELKNEYNLRKLEHEALNILAEDDLRLKMSDWDKEATSTRVIPLEKKRNLWRPLSLAASIAILVGLFIFKPWEQSMDFRELAMTEYDPNFSDLRTADDKNDLFKVVRQILRNKNTAEYDRAVQSLELIKSNSATFDKARYYLGHISWAKEDYTEAGKYFNQVPEASELKGEALYYEGLSLLANGNRSKALTLFEKLAKSTYSQSKKAKDLLETFTDE